MTMVFVAIVTCVIFISGAVTGIIGLVSLAVHREERNHTLMGPPPGYIAGAARRLNGVHVRIPDPCKTSPTGRKGARGGEWQFPITTAPTIAPQPPARADLASSRRRASNQTIPVGPGST